MIVISAILLKSQNFFSFNLGNLYWQVLSAKWQQIRGMEKEGPVNQVGGATLGPAPSKGLAPRQGFLQHRGRGQGMFHPRPLTFGSPLTPPPRGRLYTSGSDVKGLGRPYPSPNPGRTLSLFPPSQRLGRLDCHTLLVAQPNTKQAVLTVP